MNKLDRMNIRNLNSFLKDDFDIFICSASFEQRCVSIPAKVKRKNFKKTIIVENMIGSELLKDNAQQIHTLFSKKATPVKVNLNSSLEIADRITKEINAVSGRKLKVLIDVTTFTHDVLMICLKILRINNRVKSITCVYVNAAEYCPGHSLATKWLSQGCEEIRPVLGYPGMLLPSQKTHLIIVVGYEYNRAFDLISALEPNSISLVYGSPNEAITEKDHEANQVFNDLVKQMAFEFSDVESIKIPCNNPPKTAEALQELYDAHEMDNIIVVPMNNKMSTVGVSLSAFNNEKIQVCYAPAVIYNESNYSLPGTECFVFSLEK